MSEAAVLPKSFASEAGHWYDALTGEPRYRIVGANGKERDTTLRDARKHGWVPGVTTVTACAARWGLERWKAEQLLLAGLTLPRLAEETEAAWIARVWEDSKAQAQRAAERGSQIHAAIESWFRGERPDEALMPYVEAVVQALIPLGEQVWRPEKSFASPLGYGGKVDLYSRDWVIDFKTKDGDLADVKCWDDHFMQLAAYAYGLELPTAQTAVVFVTRGEWAAAKLVRHSREETERGWQMFKHLLGYWKAANGM